MLSEEFVKTLYCPDSKTPLHLADAETVARLNSQVEAGTLTNRAGAKLETRLDGGLVREDGKLLYPILDGIPVLLIDEAIELS